MWKQPLPGSAAAKAVGAGAWQRPLTNPTWKPWTFPVHLARPKVDTKCPGTRTCLSWQSPFPLWACSSLLFGLIVPEEQRRGSSPYRDQVQALGSGFCLQAHMGVLVPASWHCPRVPVPPSEKCSHPLHCPPWGLQEFSAVSPGVSAASREQVPWQGMGLAPHSGIIIWTVAHAGFWEADPSHVVKVPQAGHLEEVPCPLGCV